MSAHPTDIPGFAGIKSARDLQNELNRLHEQTFLNTVDEEPQQPTVTIHESRTRTPHNRLKVGKVNNDETLTKADTTPTKFPFMSMKSRFNQSLTTSKKATASPEWK